MTLHIRVTPDHKPADSNQKQVTTPYLKFELFGEPFLVMHGCLWPREGDPRVNWDPLVEVMLVGQHKGHLECVLITKHVLI